MLNGIWISSFVIVSVFATLLPGMLGRLGHQDPSDVYLVLTFGVAATEAALFAGTNVKPLGPFDTPFSQFVQADLSVHSGLVEDGFWVIPGSFLAELCGVSILPNVSN